MWGTRIEVVEKVTFGQRFEGVGHEDSWGKGISGEGHSPCKGLEAQLSKRRVEE